VLATESEAYGEVSSAPAACGGPRLLVTVADVAGKGIPAALLMATFHAGLRALATGPSDLKEIVERLNRYACEHSSNGRRFTTAFVAEWNADARTLGYVNAGHNPPLLRRRSGTMETLETGGLPLGIESASQYTLGKAQLDKGDALLIYSDGLVEAENAAQQQYGAERVASVFRASAGTVAAPLLNLLMQDFDAFMAGVRPQDDVTCLVLAAS
jgi:sigma-B regulation protein RsbU (phosphoserine phosphatase)